MMMVMNLTDVQKETQRFWFGVMQLDLIFKIELQHSFYIPLNIIHLGFDLGKKNIKMFVQYSTSMHFQSVHISTVEYVFSISLLTKLLKLKKLEVGETQNYGEPAKIG